MSDVAIRVEGLGKQYHLGAQQERYHTFADQIRKWTSVRRLFSRAARAEAKPPFWALKDVSFEVKRGEVVGIIGRNGAGKSTLLKILSRITEPTEGGADIYGRVGSLLEVGTGFHPELTGRENVYLNGAILGMRRAEIVRKFDEIVAFAEVEKFIDTPVKHYSSGMYMRLAFAVAANLEPDILIVDEVLAVGDAQFQKKCLGKMGDVAKGGRTVLLVSHNLTAIQGLCTHALFLRAGRISLDGSVAQCMTAYQAEVHSAIGYGATKEGSKLSDRLTLIGMAVVPPTPMSGDAVTFHLDLLSAGKSTVTHLCIILFSAISIRVAVLDLRPRDGCAIIVSDRIRISCNVGQLNLVSGDYKIGLYAVADGCQVDLQELLMLNILPGSVAGDQPIPYAPEYRGLVELNYTTSTVS